MVSGGAQGVRGEQSGGEEVAVWAQGAGNLFAVAVLLGECRQENFVSSGAQEFLMVLGLVLQEGKVQGPPIWSVTGRDWSGVKSLGKCPGQNLKMAGGAGEEFPPLQHCSHRHHLPYQNLQ